VQQHITTTGLARRALLGAAVVSALGATPALAGVGPQGVRAGHNVTVFHNIDMVAAFGNQVGGQTQIDVFRGTHHIASARGEAVDTPEGGALETNHGPEGAAQPGDCWTGATPDIQPGDRVVVSNPGGEAGLDEAIVDNINIQTVTGMDRDAATGGPPVLDDPATPANEAQPTRREIWVEGIARSVDANGVETPIPLGDLDSGEFLGPTDNQLRMSPSVVIEGAGGPGTYTAKYIEGDLNIDRNRNNIPVATILQQLEEDSHAMGYGHVAPPPPVAMLVEGMGEQAGPAPGCESAPKDASSVGTLSVDELNVANTGVADTEIVLSVGGWSQAGAVDPTVVLSDGTTSVSRPVTPGGTGQQGWTADFTKADLAGLAEGDLTVRLSVGGAPVGATRTVVYDTVAPTFSVNLAEGTYTGPQRLIVTGGPVSYTLNGGASKAYTGIPIDLGVGSHTVVLSSTDAVGNTTTRTLRYVINPVPAPQQQSSSAPAPAPAPAPQLVAPLPLIAGTPAAPRPAATMLSGQKRVGRAAARRNGLLARFSAPQGARRATLKVYRSRKGVLRLVGTKRVSVRRGANRVKLNGRTLRSRLTPGLYVIQVTLATSSGRSGAAATKFVRVVR
jgi:hypothetical protein